MFVSVHVENSYGKVNGKCNKMPLIVPESIREHSCTGLRVGENTTITISAINCGDQVGPSVPITAIPRGNQCTKGQLS